MPNSQEPSYYEIALTNRQVLGFFVVLLICVVGAFFSGVWLGQKRDGDLPTLTQVATQTDSSAESDDSLEELNFFTDTEDPKPAGKPPVTAKRRDEPAPERISTTGDPETTLLEDVEGDRGSSRPETGTAPSRTSQPEAREPVMTASSAAAGKSEGLVIQVFASPDGGQAGKLLDRLVSAGYQAFMSPVRVRGQTMHRVRIGPFDDRSQAEAVAIRVGKAYKVEPWITRDE